VEVLPPREVKFFPKNFGIEKAWVFRIWGLTPLGGLIFGQEIFPGNIRVPLRVSPFHRKGKR